MKFVLKFGFFFLIFFINLLSPVYLPSQSWELIEILPDRPDLYSVFFHDTSRGLVAGSQGALYKTTDGGRKWSKINNSSLSGDSVNIFFLDTNIGWAVGSKVFKTSNGGNSWINITPQGDLETTIFHCVYFSRGFNNQHPGWITGYGKEIFKTTNSGNNWDTTGPLYGGGLKIYGICPVSSQLVFAVGELGNIFKTTNGGVDWGYYPLTNFGNSTCYGITFKGKFGWIVGGNGLILKTTDYGTSWGDPIWLEQNDTPLYCVFFTDSVTGWVGSTGKIYNTIDGGVHWVKTELPNPVPIRKLFFTDAQHGWAVSYSGKVFKYTAPIPAADLDITSDDSEIQTIGPSNKTMLSRMTKDSGSSFVCKRKIHIKPYPDYASFSNISVTSDSLWLKFRSPSGSPIQNDTNSAVFPILSKDKPIDLELSFSPDSLTKPDIYSSNLIFRSKGFNGESPVYLKILYKIYENPVEWVDKKKGAGIHLTLLSKKSDTCKLIFGTSILATAGRDTDFGEEFITTNDLFDARFQIAGNDLSDNSPYYKFPYSKSRDIRRFASDTSILEYHVKIYDDLDNQFPMKLLWNLKDTSLDKFDLVLRIDTVKINMRSRDSIFISDKKIRDIWIYYYAPRTIVINTENPLEKSDFCPGETIKVPFTTSFPFLSSNSFKIELSEANNSWNNPLELSGSLQGTKSDTVVAVIPVMPPLDSGSKYKVRVISTTRQFKYGYECPGFIKINKAPEAPALDDITVNNDSLVTLNPVPINGVIFVWYNDKNVRIAISQNHTFSGSDSVVILYVESLDTLTNCRSIKKDTVNVKFIAPGSLEIEVSPKLASICQGESILLAVINVKADTSKSLSAYNYKWTGPNLSSTTTSSTFASPISDGQYRVEVTDTNNYQKKGIGYANVHVITLPEKPIFKFTSDTVNAGDSLELKPEDVQLNVSFNWYVNGSNMGTLPKLKLNNIQNPQIIEAESISTNTTPPCTSASRSRIIIYVRGRLSVIIQNPNLKLCKGDSVLLGNDVSVQGGDNNYSYSWQPGVYLSNPKTLSTFAYPPSDTTYTLEVKDSQNKIGEAKVNIIVYEKPVNPVITSEYTVTYGGELTLIPTKQQDVSFNWYNENGLLLGQGQDTYQLTNLTYPRTIYIESVNSVSGCKSKGKTAVTINIKKAVAYIQPGESPEIIKSPGDEFEIPIKLVVTEGIIGQASITAELRFNPVLLYPDFQGIDSSYFENNYEFRVLKFSFEINMNQIVSGGKLKFTALLGNKTETPLKLKIIDKGNTDLGSKDGIFKLEGLCNDGTQRLVGKAGGYSISAVPNPVSGECSINFTAPKNEPVKIFMLNGLGQVIKNIYEGTAQGTKGSVTIIIDDCPDGIYNILLHSEEGSASVKIQVFK